MRKLTLALMALAAASAATLTTTAPAAAADRWCVTGSDTGYPGDCSYSTYNQCLASASGRRAYCNINPSFAFREQQGWRGRGGYHPSYDSYGYYR